MWIGICNVSITWPRISDFHVGLSSSSSSYSSATTTALVFAAATVFFHSSLIRFVSTERLSLHGETTHDRLASLLPFAKNSLTDKTDPAEKETIIFKRRIRFAERIVLRRQIEVEFRTCLSQRKPSLLIAFLPSFLPSFLFMFITIYVHTYLSINFSLIYLSIYLSIFTTMSIHIYRSLIISIYLSIYLSICLSVRTSLGKKNPQQPTRQWAAKIYRCEKWTGCFRTEVHITSNNVKRFSIESSFSVSVCLCLSLGLSVPQSLFANTCICEWLNTNLQPVVDDSFLKMFRNHYPLTKTYTSTHIHSHTNYKLKDPNTLILIHRHTVRQIYWVSQYTWDSCDC